MCETGYWGPSFGDARDVEGEDVDVVAYYVCGASVSVEGIGVLLVNDNGLVDLSIWLEKPQVIQGALRMA
jgi:hypothetical protein